MSTFYKVAYWLGVTPWDDMATLPIGEQITQLFEREERERRSPYGPALELGCGRGTWTIELASRGWEVTGVDIIAKALRHARRRIQEAGIDAHLIQGDMTALRATGVGSGFRFVLDLGAVHGLNDTQHDAAGRKITAVAADDATMVLLAWAPANRGPPPRGMSREELERAFPEWALVSENPADVTGAPGFIRKARPCFYRLRRNA